MPTFSLLIQSPSSAVIERILVEVDRFDFDAQEDAKEDAMEEAADEEDAPLGRLFFLFFFDFFLSLVFIMITMAGGALFGTTSSIESLADEMEISLGTTCCFEDTVVKEVLLSG